jgi:hypothetical protein
MPSQYRRTLPGAPQELYGQHDQVEFMLTGSPNQAIVPGSVRLEFDFLAQTDAPANIAAGDQVYYDKVAGLHSLVNSITTSTKMQGVLENFNNYPRFVKQKRLCTKNMLELGTVSDTAAEGCAVYDKGTKLYMGGYTAADATVGFSLKLENCLNNASGPISFEKTGDIRLRLRLAAVEEFFFGVDANLNYDYELSNMRLSYQVTDAPKQQDKPTILQVISSSRDIITTNVQQVDALVPMLTDAVICSCIRTSTEVDVEENYLQCEPVTGTPLSDAFGLEPRQYGFERIQYLVNSTETALHSYPLESRNEILLNALRVFQDGTGSNMLNMLGSTQVQSNICRSDDYVFGVSFGQLLDFHSQKFSIELHSQTTAASPVAIYMYFRGIAEI